MFDKLRGLPLFSMRTIQWFITILFLLLAIWASLSLSKFDYTQNYVPTRAWMQGSDPNGKLSDLLKTCCPDQSMPETELEQTAHPPFTTLIIMPWALLPWVVSLWAWRVFGAVLILWIWYYAQVPPIMRVVSICFASLALALGTWEPLLLACVGVCILQVDKNPVRAGAILGFAIALKTYPVVLLLGLILTKRWSAAISAVLTAGLLSLLAELILGFGTTQAWLVYLPINTLTYVDEVRNISVVRIIRTAVPNLSPIVAFAISACFFVGALIPSLFRTRDVRLLLPVMLLTSPISWVHYFIFLGLVKDVPRIVIVLLALGGFVIYIVWVGLIPGDNMAVFGYTPLLVANIILWYRDARIGLVPRAN